MKKQINKIREQRKKLCYSTREFSKICNIPETKIINYETNKTKAKLITIRKMAKATNTKVEDWVEEEYFGQTEESYNKSLEKCIEKENTPSITNDEEREIAFFRGMYRADEVMDVLYTALIEMEDIKRTEDKKDILFSEFAKTILINVSVLKLKKVYDICKSNKKIEDKNLILKRQRIERFGKKRLSIEDITYSDLFDEFQIIFKHTDTFKIIIQALDKMDCIDSEGNCIGKGKILLDKVIANKIKNTII